MNKDARYTYVHMHHSQHADLFEDFCKDKLPADDVFVPPHLQPINPEDEDDVVPDQHAAFGIQKATQGSTEPAWRDLGLGELMTQGPGGGPRNAAEGGRAAGTGNGAGAPAGTRSGAPKRRNRGGATLARDAAVAFPILAELPS
ncbi:hypothetical protein P8C59_006122 [Phyllachora maydis]|uniref:Anaphase-promoting complex subunit 13 n=1 Tax=Phyllachora maydis TaxID=1825666 RepID=A0AAD9MF72_9PEZI|nr:hypothetical protein P8C59_006122 [Phyllachora maydis]